MNIQTHEITNTQTQTYIHKRICKYTDTCTHKYNIYEYEKHNYTHVQNTHTQIYTHRYTRIYPTYKNTNTQRYTQKYTIIQIYKYTAIHMYRYTNIPMQGNTRGHT